MPLPEDDYDYDLNDFCLEACNNLNYGFDQESLNTGFKDIQMCTNARKWKKMAKTFPPSNQ